MTTMTPQDAAAPSPHSPGAGRRQETHPPRVPAARSRPSLPHAGAAGDGHPIRLVSLCSGYGGLEMAIGQVLDVELVAVADNDPGAAAILAHHFPSVPNLGDITKVDWSSTGPVDILCAGFPCQDVSCAGARVGLREGTRTGVWAHVARAIAELRPPLVVLENVGGLLSAWADSDMEPCTWCLGETGTEHALRAAGAVCGDLATLGFDADWTVVSAADAGAPHRRERVFIIGWPFESRAAGDGSTGLKGPGQAAQAGWPVAAVGAAADSEAAGGRRRSGTRPAGTTAESGEPGGLLAEPDDGRVPVAADPDGQPVRVRAGGLSASPGEAERPPAERERLRPDHSDGSADAADAERHGLEGRWAAAGQNPGRPGTARVGRGPADSSEPAEDADRATSGERGKPAPGQAPPGWPRADAGGPGGARRREVPSVALGVAPNSEGDRRDEGRPEPARVVWGPDAAERSAEPAADPGREHGNGWPGAGNDRRTEAEWQQAVDQADRHCSPPAVAWGTYELAIRRWEHVLGRPAPRPVEPGRTGERLSPRFVEWMMGLPDGWVTGVPGLSRNAQLKALGNGVVPQQAVLALRLLLDAISERGESVA